MVVVVACVTIIAVLLGLAIGFYLGIRYAFRNLLHVWLARMDLKELEELSERASRERRDEE